MKHLLGLLLVMGMVGCGGGDEAPPAGEAALQATPNEPQAKVDEPPVQTVDTPPAGEAALPATPKTSQAKVNEPSVVSAAADPSVESASVSPTTPADTGDDPPVQAVDFSKLVERDGLMYEGDSETPFTGVSVKKYENGWKQEEVPVKDGKLEGLATAWHENGQKEREGTFKDGKPEGLATAWHENGQKAGEAIFKDGKLVSGTEWDEEGNEIKK